MSEATGVPGGNVTGMTILSPQLSRKRLELLKEVLPQVSRVAVLYNPTFPGTGLDLQETLATGGATVPIIFITGHGDAAMNLRALKAGAVDFLQKPFDERALLDAVRDALARPR